MTEYAKLEGLKETVAALKALPAQFASKNGGPIRKAMVAAAKPMRDAVIAKVPIDTGNLRANIYIYRDRNPQSIGATERFIIGVRGKKAKYARTRLNVRLGRVGKNYRLAGDAFYWRFVEFGTEKQSAQPFLRPAFEEGKVRFVGDFAEQMRKGVEAAVQRAKRAAGA